MCQTTNARLWRPSFWCFLRGISHEKLQPKEQLPLVNSILKMVQKSLVSSRSLKEHTQTYKELQRKQPIQNVPNRSSKNNICYHKYISGMTVWTNMSIVSSVMKEKYNTLCKYQNSAKHEQYILSWTGTHNIRRCRNLQTHKGKELKANGMDACCGASCVGHWPRDSPSPTQPGMLWVSQGELFPQQHSEI